MGLIKKFKKSIYDYIDNRVDKTREYFVEEINELKYQNALLREEMALLNSKEECRIKLIKDKLLFFAKDNDGMAKSIVLQLQNSYITPRGNYKIEKYEKSKTIPNSHELIITFHTKSNLFAALYLIADDCLIPVESAKVWRTINYCL